MASLCSFTLFIWFQYVSTSLCYHKFILQVWGDKKALCIQDHGDKNLHKGPLHEFSLCGRAAKGELLVPKNGHWVLLPSIVSLIQILFRGTQNVPKETGISSKGYNYFYSIRWYIRDNIYKILTNKIYWYLMTKLPNTLCNKVLSKFIIITNDLTSSKVSQRYNVLVI